MARSGWASLALTGWPVMTVALAKLASPGPFSSWVGRAIGIFPYVLIRENSDCCAARVSDVRILSNFAQVDNLPKGTKLSSGLTKKNTKFIFCLPPYWTGPRARGHWYDFTTKYRPRYFLTVIMKHPESANFGTYSSILPSPTILQPVLK